MKKLLALSLLGCILSATNPLQAQGDKSKRASPPAKVSQTINTGATVSIEYSRPSVKGRTIGKDLEPMQDKVWRMGANEATTFEVDKEVKINGKALPAGKYSLFGIAGEKDFTVIFNKAASVWGTQYEKNKEQNALQLTVVPHTPEGFTEQLTYTIDAEGKVALLWGNMNIVFFVQ